MQLLAMAFAEYHMAQAGQKPKRASAIDPFFC